MTIKRLMRCILAFAILASAIVSPALAETYPVYEVITRPALLRKIPELSSVPLSEDSNIIGTVPMNSLVLVASIEDGWSLVYTQDELTGYLQCDSLRDTGETYFVDFTISAEEIAGNDAVQIDYITIDPQAQLPDESAVLAEYPASLTRGGTSYSLQTLLDALLGEGYEQKERNEYSYADEYESTASDKPNRSLKVIDASGEIRYRDGMVAGERGAEYEPPEMNMTIDESLVFCQALLTGIVDSSWLARPGNTRSIEDRWSYSERWMTESEYNEYMRNAQVHYHVFEHWFDEKICILDDQVLATVGVNGLSEISINWHSFEASGEETIAPISLQAAIEMANSTRYAKTTLLCAQLVYSNRVTGTDIFNLSWYLVTSKGNYVVDCVLGAHVCDSYEY